MNLQRIRDEILEFFFPSRCVFCHRWRGKGVRFCKGCRKALPYAPGPAAEQKIAHMDRCLSPLYYEGSVRASLLRYKFGGQPSYASVYGDLLADCLAGHPGTWDCIAWVPLSRRRLRHRGYDQAELLARELGSRLGLPVESLLRKRRHTRAQSATGDARKRQANIAGAYQVSDPEGVRGRRILLVDDIVTTGSTLSECAKTLRAAGAASVTGLTLARKRE